MFQISSSGWLVIRVTEDSFALRCEILERCKLSRPEAVSTQVLGRATPLLQSRDQMLDRLWRTEQIKSPSIRSIGIGQFHPRE